MTPLELSPGRTSCGMTEGRDAMPLHGAHTAALEQPGVGGAGAPGLGSVEAAARAVVLEYYSHGGHGTHQDCDANCRLHEDIDALAFHLIEATR